jgi:putative endonuclease
MSDKNIAKLPKENHWDAGRRGEDLALAYLLEKGYTLIRRNYRHGKGEIDLVMHDPQKVLVFIEVKSSRTLSAGNPIERIEGRKVRQLQKMAQRYCWEFHQEDRDMRFDIIGVDLTKTFPEAILHIPAAFIPNGAAYYTTR